MKNEINAVLENMTAATPEPGDYTGEDGLLYCGKCRKPKEAYFAPIRPLSLAVTATRQNATARERPRGTGGRRKSGAGT